MKKMGKRHNKGSGSFRTLKKGEVPDNIKDMLGEQDKSVTEAIEGRLRDFVQMQLDYHKNIYSMAVTRTELEAMMSQIKLEDLREMKWNGMIIPLDILKARTGLKNITYKDLVHQSHSLRKGLTNLGVTQKQLEDIGTNGKFVKKLPIKKINEGKEANGINKG